MDGAVVHDLGAGDLTLSHTLLQCGAFKVVAVDRAEMPEPLEARIERVTTYFDQFRDPIDVAFLSWPVNWPCGLEVLAKRSRLVIYLGQNTDGTACGYPDLWWHLRTREVLHQVFEDPGTSLLVYGPGTRKGKSRLPEEHAALDPQRVWSYEELEKWSRSRSTPPTMGIRR